MNDADSRNVLLARPERAPHASASNSSSSPAPIQLDNITGQGILEWLDRACKEFANSIAIEWRGTQVSYAALDSRANQTANCLRAGQLLPGSIIAIMLEDRIEMIAALIAVFRAGCVYVPLDLESPDARLSPIVSELAPDAFLISIEQASRVDRLYGSCEKPCHVIVLGTVTDLGF